MRAPIRDVISRLQGLLLADAGFHDNNRPDTDMRENKCQWLFGGNTLSPVIHCPSPHQDKTDTQIHLSPPTFCSLSPHACSSFTAEKMFSLSAFLVCTYISPL